MNLASNIIINMYSTGILIVIYIFSLKHNEENSLQNKLYKWLLKITILMLFVDILSRFDGKTEPFYPLINHIGNFVVFLLNPIMSSLWLVYVYDQIYHKIEKPKYLLLLINAVNGLNLVLLICTQFFGWYYYIDTDNIYHRGPLFLFAALVTTGFVLAAFILTLINRDRIDKKHFFSLIFCGVSPFVCIIIQINFYGLSIVLHGIVFSLLIVALYVQNNNIYTDYLTGVYNRKKLELYLKQKISLSTNARTFSAIMLDLDNFKSINDTYGHDTGDRALQISAKLLRGCLRSNDFISRFGGDEFCVILDISDEIKLEETVTKIRYALEKYNCTNAEPFNLSFSMGYSVYDFNSNLSTKEFQKLIDKYMYDNKQITKEKKLN
ncbi:GGDEF domain-containing protein [Anaerocolumna sp. MB42-C2]|uniref:GGDEF domain-containing protein n=1 Tax=Anaerocolumna sp. MB42-C2 TaxID=3070997 RepID=UPI0027E0CAB1|nr:GGDEF domain-containing protein [Anaerocolumna sp. MB42-C2]WMJ88378.1 diguanylate cyclase [Anaerocolumna sp. MB42-C2]